MSIAPAPLRAPVDASAQAWGTSTERGLGRSLLVGAAVWGLFAAIYVAAHGVLLDESVVPAQIITGAVHYPAGHPHQVYYTEAYSLSNYLSAAILQLTDNVWLLSALHNWLTLFCATFLPFSATLLLTRSPIWGHVAAVLTLTEAAVAFMGVYPLWVFPATYSTGNTSLHIALIAAVLLLAGFRRFGGVSLGLLPSIHPALALLIWGWTAVYVFVQRAHWPRRQIASFGVSIAVGLAVCLALGGIVLLELVRATSSGAPPYVPADINGDLVRRGYITLSDVHRRLFDFPSVAYLLNPAAFAGVSALLLWSAWRRRTAGLTAASDAALGWLVLLGSLAWLAIYGAGVVQAIFGSLPDLIATLMPYRLSNVTALLLIPLAVSGVAAVMTSHAVRRSSVWGVIGLMLLVLAVRVIIDRESVFRNSLYVVLAVFFAADAYAHRRHVRRCVASVAVMIALGGIAWRMLLLRQEIVYLFGTWVAVAVLLWGGDVVVRLWAMRPRVPRAAFGAVLALGCAAAAVGTFVSPSVWNQADMVYDASGRPTVAWDAMSPYDQSLGDWLRTNAAPDEMILSAVWPRSELQAKVGHPVLFELETLPLMTYLPAVAGSTGVLARDLYGVDYSQPDQLAQLTTDGRLQLTARAWWATWTSRSRSEWQALGRKYAFRLVLAPTSTRIDLPVALPGPAWTLYTIP